MGRPRRIAPRVYFDSHTSGGRWRVDHTDANARRHRPTFPTPEAAHEFAARLILAAPQAPAPVVPTDRRLSDFFIDEYWPLWAEQHLQDNTKAVYMSMWNTHVVDRLGRLYLLDITTKVAAGFQHELVGAGVGKAAIVKTMSMLQGVFRCAIEWHDLPRNPFKLVRKVTPERPEAVQPATPVEVELLRSLFVVLGDQASARMVGLLGRAGVRPGEARALQVRHVGQRTILVEQSFGPSGLKELKTGYVRRTVTQIAPFRSEMRLGDSHDFVVVTPDGRAWDEQTYDNWRERRFAKAVAALELQIGRPYDLRHSFASLLLRSRPQELKTIADELGHSVETLLKHYGHILDEYREAGVIDAAQETAKARELVAAGALRARVERAAERMQRRSTKGTRRTQYTPREKRKAALAVPDELRAHVTAFVDDDAGYVDWCASHPDGWVLNVGLRPSQPTLVIHRVDCERVSGIARPGGMTSGDAAKACGDDHAALSAFAVALGRGDPKRTCSCVGGHPPMGPRNGPVR